MTEEIKYNIDLVNTYIDNYLLEHDKKLLEEDLGHAICDGPCKPESDDCDKCILHALIIKLEEAYESHDANLNKIANELRTTLHNFIKNKLGG